MLVTTKELFKICQEKHCAIGAFNVENMEMVQAVISAAEEMRAPVIMQTTPSTLKYATPEYFQANAAVAAKNADVPVVMHLDHGNSVDLAKQCIEAGYSSVMIDGSKESFEDNISMTKQVVAFAGDISVEAELGKVGGKEDDLVVEDNNPYTDPMEAKEFVERTGCDSLAVGIGTAHGVYKGEPNVRIDILKDIRAQADIPLVMHGTSGVPDEVVSEAIKHGICKVNYATDLRIAFTKAVREVLKDESVIDPKKYGILAREYVKQYVMDKIKVCGSNSFC